MKIRTMSLCTVLAIMGWVGIAGAGDDRFHGPPGCRKPEPEHRLRRWRRSSDRHEPVHGLRPQRGDVGE